MDTRTDDYRPTEPGTHAATDREDVSAHSTGETTGETVLDPQREDTRYRSDPA